nr:divergent polysaccharide deacetylase family protein [uncultured Desulfobulbus sp.]
MTGSFLRQGLLSLALALILALLPEPLHQPARLQPQRLSPITVSPIRDIPAPPPSSASSQPTMRPQAELAYRRPQVAIIIDDMGYNREIGLQLLALQLPLSFSFLPQAPHTQELAQEAHERGKDILVHLPMEPKAQDWKQEPLTLLAGEDGETLHKKTRLMLDAVPRARGANSHMGSRLTERQREMHQVLQSIKKGQFYFIDSYTTSGSVALETARRLHIPTARRKVFLDNEQQEAAICNQLARLADLATREAKAIAIGHPNQAMLAALQHCASRSLSEVQLVGAEELVRSAP